MAWVWYVRVSVVVSTIPSNQRQSETITPRRLIRSFTLISGSQRRVLGWISRYCCVNAATFGAIQGKGGPAPLGASYRRAASHRGAEPPGIMVHSRALQAFPGPLVQTDLPIQEDPR